ncbi:MAG: endo alpha-1,4 polygalactosaminidase [Anaerolineae bacterium]|nr:endo alpha-1,4 polygalactosaminidase [Anaerolineae bacterium]
MPIQRPSRFACYYGLNCLEQLAEYDLVIVQAENYTAADLTPLQARGTSPFGYLSLSQVADTDSTAPWALREATTGAVVRNSLWQTVLVDCRSAAWQRFIIEEQIPWLLQHGIHGLFLDHVDVDARFAETWPGVANLLRRIRWEHPDLALLANRGFSVLDVVAETVDGVVFESFSTYYDDAGYAAWTGADLQWTEQAAVRLQEILGKRPILTLDYAPPGDATLRQYAERRAQTYGFTPFVTVGQLDSLP